MSLVNRGLIGLALAILATISQASDFRVRVGSDSLKFGSKGTEIVIPILIDSVSAADSLAEYRFKIDYDTTRLQAFNILTTGTLSDGPEIEQAGGQYEYGGFVVSAFKSPNYEFIGKGILINIIFNIINDSSGCSEISFDTSYTQFGVYDFTNPNGQVSNKAGETIGSEICFFPTANIEIDSQTIKFSGDTLSSVPIWLRNVRGDGVKSFSVRVKSENRKFSFENIDTSGTLLGEFISNGGWSLPVISDSGKVLTLSAHCDSAIKVLDSLPLLKLNTYLQGDSSFNSAVLVDSVEILGYNEKFLVNVSNGEFKFVYAPKEDVEESGIPKLQSLLLYPNPANGFVFIRGQDNNNFGIAGIYDLSGKMISKLQGYQSEINTELIPAGSYFVWVKQMSSVSIVKLNVVH